LELIQILFKKIKNMSFKTNIDLLKLLKNLINLSLLDLICIPKEFNFVIIVIEKTTKMKLITLNLIEFQSVSLLCSFFLEYYFWFIRIVCDQYDIVFVVIKGCNNVVFGWVNWWPWTYFLKNKLPALQLTKYAPWPNVE